MTPDAQRDFSFDGKAYQIRAIRTASGYRVAAFLGALRANALAYSMDFETVADFERVTGSNPYECLMDLAESDVRMGRFEGGAR